MIFAGDHKEKPSLYVNSTDWEPDPSQIPVELCVCTAKFLRSIKKLFPRQTGNANLLLLQHAAFKYLKCNSDLLVLKSDKNLGPCVMEKQQYLHHAYSDHLDDHKTYRELSPEQAELRVQTIRKIILRFLDRYFPILDKNVHPDRVYLERMLKKTTSEAAKKDVLPISAFYLLAKIHKQPLST